MHSIVQSSHLGARGGASVGCKYTVRARAVATAAAAGRPKMATLITFDVDGTLIHAVGKESNALHKEAFSRAMKKVFDVDTHIDIVKHHGATDPLVLLKVLVEAHGLDKATVLDKMNVMTSCMMEHYEAQKERSGEGLELLPGIRELLTALQAKPDVYVGLVTGNLEPIGWAKMEALGIKGLFSQPPFGGFGSDLCSGNLEEVWRDRGEFIKIAKTKCGVNISSLYHVGDTPFDVLAAKEAGAVPVGVTTGIFTAEELTAAVPETVLVSDFSSLPAALAVFGLQP